MRVVPQLLRTIEAAAIAGLLYSALSLAATFILSEVPDPGDGERSIREWYADGGNQYRVILAVNLAAVSSVLFVWFVAVIRRRVGDRENRFFGTVFLGSALLLAGSWLTAAVFFAAPAVAANTFDVVPSVGAIAMTQASGTTMVSIVSARLEAVFVISTTTVGRLSGAFPRWMVVLSYGVGLVLLLAPLPSLVVTWVFPTWVALISSTLLIRRDSVRVAGG